MLDAYAPIRLYTRGLYVLQNGLGARAPQQMKQNWIYGIITYTIKTFVWWFWCDDDDDDDVGGRDGGNDIGDNDFNVDGVNVAKHLHVVMPCVTSFFR